MPGAPYKPLESANSRAKKLARLLRSVEVVKGKTDVSLRLVVPSVGGSPAFVEISSDSTGSNIRLGAAQILFGENTVFDDATDTLTTSIAGAAPGDGTKHIEALGLPFGSDSLLEWIGPDNIAMASATRANAYFFIAMADPRIGGTAFPTGAAAIKDGPVGGTLDVLIPNGQSRNATAFYASTALAVAGSVTIQIRYREVGAAVWTNIGASQTDSGGPGDILGAGLATATITNVSGIDQRYEVSVDISTTGSPSVNNAQSYLKV